MSETLLRTKLYVPPLRPKLVPRPRLIARLNQGLHLGHKLTLISAPAGFGKSTLLSAWIQQVELKMRAAWLSLDEGENDLTRLLTYFVAAIRTIDSNIGQGVLAALQSPGTVNVEAVLTTLLNEIAEFPDQMVLVIDDYHVIESRPIDKAINFWLEHQPPQVHLAIVSRIDPSLALSRLRARGQMAEIRADDLRFTTDEAAAFLNQVMGFNLSAQDAAALGAQTEGWITGLQLAALSMQGSDDVPGIVHSFTGSDRYILDYFGEEVLSRQSQNVQDFLLHTSLLSRLTGSLCDAITGSSDGQEMLERLERENLFLVPLDNERYWYRYHHLFANLLQARLRRLHPHRVTVNHLRATGWFEENGLMVEAVDHAVSAKDYDRAASLIERVASGTMFHGRLNTILRWLDALPRTMLDTRPRLRFYQAWALSIAGQPQVAEKILIDAKLTLESLPPSAENLALRGELAALLAGIILYSNDAPRIIREAEEALTYLPKEDLVSRARVTIALGIAYAYGNEMQEATESYELTRDLALSAKNPFLATAAIELLADMQFYHQGR
jgi:LuxR family maltose regulon positive regulatory protein